QVLRKAKSMGLQTSLDTAWDARGKWLGTLRPTLPYIDYFLPSFDEAKECVDDAQNSPSQIAHFFQQQGVGTVALKMGEDGSYVLGKAGEELWLPSFDVQAVDANGAGDAFAAGFLAAI